MTPQEEARFLLRHINSRIPSHLDGKACVKGMKNFGSNNWRQIEWQGFFFEEAALSWLDQINEGGRGPTLSGTTFDYEREYVWDFKVHTTHTKSGNKRYQMYLNDAYSTEQCIEEKGGIGFIVAHGQAEYDFDREFQQWHRQLKGGKSAYSKKREERGANSRIRKQAFDIEKVTAHFIPTMDDLQDAIDDGWLKRQGQGRNSNGNSRNDKYVMKPHSSETIALSRYGE